MRRGLPELLAFSLLTLPAAAGADVLLTYQRNAPEMVLPSGQVSGGHTAIRILLATDRLREETDRGVRILRRDTHALYFSARTGYCQFRFPLDLKAEVSSELYENLMRHPREEGQAVVATSKLPNRKVGSWEATGTRIEIRSGPQSWRKVSVWTTDQLPQVPYPLVADLRLALAPLARSGVTLALYQELAKLPGVPVRIETDSESPLLGTVHTDEELAAVEQRAATEADYQPPKGLKRVSSDLCALPSAGLE